MLKHEVTALLQLVPGQFYAEQKHLHPQPLFLLTLLGIHSGVVAREHAAKGLANGTQYEVLRPISPQSTKPVLDPQLCKSPTPS